jgi:hypothetical protein
MRVDGKQMRHTRTKERRFAASPTRVGVPMIIDWRDSRVLYLLLLGLDSLFACGRLLRAFALGRHSLRPSVKAPDPVLRLGWSTKRVWELVAHRHRLHQTGALLELGARSSSRR